MVDMEHNATNRGIMDTSNNECGNERAKMPEKTFLKRKQTKAIKNSVHQRERLMMSLCHFELFRLPRCVMRIGLCERQRVHLL